MHKKLKCTALVSMILLVSIGLFGSTGVSQPVPPNPTLGVVEYDYYVVAGLHMNPTLPAPAPQPVGFTFDCTAFGENLSGHYNLGNAGYNFGNLTYFAPKNYLYEGVEEADPAKYIGSYVVVNITNNVGYTITIEDLTAEVTDGTSMKHWTFALAGNILMGNMSVVAVDTLDPWDVTAPAAPYDEVDYNTGVVDVHRDLHGIARSYPDWYRYETGIQGSPYPSTQLGPGSLMLPDPLGDADSTGHVPPKYGGTQGPITLANGANFTEYFGITLFGQVDLGTQIDATITLRLKYSPPRPMKLHAQPEELINLYDPLTTMWHELYPTFSNIYHLSSWHDDNLDGRLSAGDEIDLYDGENETWWFVNHIPLTLNLSWVDGDEWVPRILVESEIDIEHYPFDIVFDTMWHEAWPTWCEWWVVTNWIDNGDQVLSVSDLIVLFNLKWGITATYHVDSMATDLELYPEIADIYLANAISVFPGFNLVDAFEAFPEWILPINVTVKNMGTLPLAGTVNGYYSLDNSSYLSMGISQQINLSPCNGTLLNFYWNLKTTGAGKEVYFMKFTVNASYIGPNQNKNLWSYDEFFVKVKVRLMGDVDGDNDCDVGDQRKVQLAMFKGAGPPPDLEYTDWNSYPNFTDMDGDGDVDVGDQRKQQLWMFKSWEDP